MNSLSWLIYAAAVLPNMATMVGMFILVSCAVVMVFALIQYIGVCDAVSSGTEDKSIAKGSLKKTAKTVAITMVLTFIVVGVVPDSKTIYMIAGSEAAEAVVSSEDGQEVLADIKEIIQLQLTNMKDK